MATYYVSTQSDPQGNHEVHTSVCQFAPPLRDRFFLGEFKDWHKAVAEAAQTFPTSKGCPACCTVAIPGRAAR